MKIEGPELADAYAAMYKHLGKVWATYDEDDRTITLRGDGLEPHPDMKSLYPNGWCLSSTISVGEARMKVGLHRLKNYIDERLKIVHDADGGAELDFLKGKIDDFFA